jgi:hypothetical protein
MTRKMIGVGAPLFASLIVLTTLASAQTPPPPAVTVLQPVPGPAPTAPPPGQPPVVVLQPAQPPPPPVAPAPPPTVYVYELPPPPSYAYAAPPPPPPAPPKKVKHADVHNHDGFYLRMGIGVGALVLSNEKRSESDTTLSTGGAAIEFGMGGTIGDGFVLGGRVIGVGGESLELETTEGRSNIDGSLSYATVQLFADWYLDPESGLHIEGALGPAGVSYDPTPSGGREDGLDGDEVDLEGFGGSLGIGLEGWVGEQWSLGGLLRVNWAALDGNLDPAADGLLMAQPVDGSESGTVIAVAPMLMLTGTFH